MENLLRSEEYWTVVEYGIPALTPNATAEVAKTVEDAKLRDLKTKNYLYQSIERGILESITKKDAAKDLWEAMKQIYQGSTKVKRAQLQAMRKEYEMLHMKDDENVSEFVARVMTVVNRMKAHGEAMEQLTMVEKILRSMNDKFEYVVCSITESKDVTTMTVEELTSRLLVHEARMKNHKVIKEKEEEEEHALKTTIGVKMGGTR